MPDKRSNPLAAIAFTLFTSLVAPTLVSLVTISIKADESGRTQRVSSPPTPVATARADSSPTVVTLLPPTIAPSFSPAAPPLSRTTTSARPLTWRPAN